MKPIAGSSSGRVPWFSQHTRLQTTIRVRPAEAWILLRVLGMQAQVQDPGRGRNNEIPGMSLQITTLARIDYRYTSQAGHSELYTCKQPETSTFSAISDPGMERVITYISQSCFLLATSNSGYLVSYPAIYPPSTRPNVNTRSAGNN